MEEDPAKTQHRQSSHYDHGVVSCLMQCGLSQHSWGYSAVMGCQAVACLTIDPWPHTVQAHGIGEVYQSLISLWLLSFVF